jgi:hypothetical protein
MTAVHYVAQAWIGISLEAGDRRINMQQEICG